MNDNLPGDLVSWFKFFDLEYINAALAAELEHLDINDPADQETLIQKAVLPEYCAHNDVSKESLKELLVAAEDFDYDEIQEAYDSINPPFSGELEDINAFLKRILARLD
jgi:hypothetical protein